MTKTLGQIAYEAHEMERMLTLYRWKRQRNNTPWKRLGKRRKNEWENIADAVAEESHRRMMDAEIQRSEWIEGDPRAPTEMVAKYAKDYDGATSRNFNITGV